MSNILVTGGAGFIGSHLIKKLVARGDQVITIDNFNNYYNPALKEARVKIFLADTDFKLYRKDICDLEALKDIFKEHRIDKIVHLAALAGVRYSLKDPFTFEQVNGLGTLNLLEMAKDYQVKNFVYASSSSVYGGNQKFPSSEDDNVDKPVSLYAANKKANELMAYTYHHIYKLPTIGLRFFTVYGPWGRPDMALFLFARGILENRPIDVYNYGKMQRDFTYIDDIVDGIIAALDKNYDYEIFNLGNSEVIELEYFIKVIEDILGKKAQRNDLPMQAGDVLKSYADITKAKKMLGYNPKTSIEEGIKKFLDWYLEYRGKINNI